MEQGAYMEVRLSRMDLLVLLVLVIWAFGFSVIKYGLREMGPLSFATLRFVAAGILMLGWAWVAEGKPVIRRGDWLRVALVGLTTIGAYQALFTVGLKYTTASNSSLMLASIPAWTALFAMSSREERISAWQGLGIAMSFTGVALVIVGGGGDVVLSWESVQGDVLTLIAAALYGFGMVLSKPLLLRYSSLRLMSISIVFGSVLLLLVSGPELAAQEWSRVSLATWAGVGFTALFGAVFAFVIWFKAVGELGAVRTAIYNNLIPPMAIVFAFATLGESLTPLQAAGAAIVIAGVTMTRFGQSRAATTT
jgi:drug/metabolite transporter (DMT)-like permease